MILCGLIMWTRYVASDLAFGMALLYGVQVYVTIRSTCGWICQTARKPCQMCLVASCNEPMKRENYNPPDPLSASLSLIPPVALLNPFHSYHLCFIPDPNSSSVEDGEMRL